MSISFPLVTNLLADRLKIESVKWILNDNQELNGLGSGELLAADLAPRLWDAEIQCGLMEHDEAAELQALFESLDGAINTMFLYDPRKSGPRRDPDGSILGAAEVTIKSVGANNKSLSLQALPAGYVLSVGDMLAFDYGTDPVRRALHRIVEAATADGSGDTVEFEVRPHFRPGVDVDLDVMLIKPSAKVKIVPGTFSSASSSSTASRLTFNARQTLT